MSTIQFTARALAAEQRARDALDLAIERQDVNAARSAMQVLRTATEARIAAQGQLFAAVKRLGWLDD